MKRTFYTLIAMTVIALTPAQATAEVRYTLATTLTDFTAWKTNEGGQIAGWSSNGGGLAQLYTPGVGLQTLPIPQGVGSSYGYVLNERGQVGGQLNYKSTYWGTTYQSFVYTPGTPDSTQLLSTRISIGSELTEDGFARQVGGAVPDWTVGTGVATEQTTNGYATGYSYFNSRNSYGAAWLRNPDGTFVAIGQEFPDAESQGYGVNSSGAVVGRLIPSTGGISAFAYLPGTGVIDLFASTDADSRSGWIAFASAQDIADDGRIVGWGIYSQGGQSIMSSFVLNPVSAVPEPATYLSMLLGILSLAFVLKRGPRRPTVKDAIR